MFQKIEPETHDKENWKPVICNSVTEEYQVAGFKEIQTNCVAVMEWLFRQSK